MSAKKIIVVFGATGNQGGSVVKAILGDPVAAEQFHIRAITRDPSKPAAAALAEKGVAVVKADMDDKDSLREALKDAYVVFSVTNFMEHLMMDREVQQGKNVADVAKELNIQHLIWSSLPHVSKISNGKYTKVFHFDGKALVAEHIRSLGIPATILNLGVFMNYSLFMLMPVPDSPKSYKLCIPLPGDTKWPLISVVEDTGKYVKAILLNREKMLGKEICGAERDYTLEECVGLLKKAGVDVTFEQSTFEDYRKMLEANGLPEFFRDDMCDNMKYCAEYGLFGGGGLEAGHAILTEPLQTYEEWIAESPEVAALK